MSDHPGKVVDLTKKLNYLLKVRGGWAMDRNGKQYAVRRQKTLADALNKDPSRIAEWKRDGVITDLSTVGPRIAEIFSCDEVSFRRDDYQSFVEKTEGKAIGWAAAVAGAAVAGRIEQWPPARPGEPVVRAHKAGDTESGFEDENLPVLPPGATFKLSLPVPQLHAPGKPSALHVMLFNGDSDGYLNWVPRSRWNTAYRGVETVTGSATEVALPSAGGEMKVGRTARGDHDVVLVVTYDPLPGHLNMELEQDAQDDALQPTLEKLAGWLAPRLRQGTAGIVRRTFFVGSLQ